MFKFCNTIWGFRWEQQIDPIIGSLLEMKWALDQPRKTINRLNMILYISGSVRHFVFCLLCSYTSDLFGDFIVELSGCILNPDLPRLQLLRLFWQKWLVICPARPWGGIKFNYVSYDSVFQPFPSLIICGVDHQLGKYKLEK